MKILNHKWLRRIKTIKPKLIGCKSNSRIYWSWLKVLLKKTKVIIISLLFIEL
jgi:hypothetical protein